MSKGEKFAEAINRLLAESLMNALSARVAAHCLGRVINEQNEEGREKAMTFLSQFGLKFDIIKREDSVEIACGIESAVFKNMDEMMSECHTLLLESPETFSEDCEGVVDSYFCEYLEKFNPS
tara:strand:+ start:817 stop:1182 length:366 start_codon:yes stop_codon:yes gene_type:complete